MVAVEYNVHIKEVEPLAEGRWADWSRTMMFSFMQARLADYLDGENEPLELSMQKQKQEWLAINSRIIGTVQNVIETSERFWSKRHETSCSAASDGHDCCRGMDFAQKENPGRQYHGQTECHASRHPCPIHLQHSYQQYHLRDPRLVFEG